jgi:glycosyltransferase involved in cell wall biosynthesis
MRNQLKVMFLPTSCAGVTFQRLLQFFRYIQKDKTMNPAMDKFDPNRSTPYEWQFKNNTSSSLLVEMEKVVNQADIVVMGYVLSDYAIAIIQGLVTLFPNKPLITEIDDYCLEVNHYSPAAVAFKPGTEASNAILEQLSLSTAVIASTPYLKKLYSEYNSKIYVIPNGIDFNIWDKLKYPKHGKRIRIGWCGAASHNEDLRFVWSTILQILDKYPNVEFYCMAGVPEFIAKCDHPRVLKHQGWYNPYLYPQALVDRKFDIGIAPLLDNNFNRAKSNLRWLEYSAMKIPTVASSVEDFKRTVVDGKTGFLVREKDEWFNKLSFLIENEDKRKEIGLNAYKEIKKNFNIEFISKEYVRILKEIYNDSKRNKGQGEVVSSRGISRTHNRRKPEPINK